MGDTFRLVLYIIEIVSPPGGDAIRSMTLFDDVIMFDTLRYLYVVCTVQFVPTMIYLLCMYLGINIHTV